MQLTSIMKTIRPTTAIMLRKSSMGMTISTLLAKVSTPHLPSPLICSPHPFFVKARETDITNQNNAISISALKTHEHDTKTMHVRGIVTSGGSGKHGNDDKKTHNTNANNKHGSNNTTNDHPSSLFPDTSKPDYKSFIFFGAGVFITSAVFMYREKHGKEAVKKFGGEAAVSAGLESVVGGEVDGTVAAEKEHGGLALETEEDKKERERKQLYRDYLSYLTSR